MKIAEMIRHCGLFIKVISVFLSSGMINYDRNRAKIQLIAIRCDKASLLTPPLLPVKVYYVNIPIETGKETEMDNEYRKIAGAFLVGGLIGAAIALLYAPQSGRETRKDITKTARRIRRETMHVVEDAVDSINEFAGDIKEKISDVIERGRDLSQEAKKELLRNLEQGQKILDKQRKRIVESLGM